MTLEEGTKAIETLHPDLVFFRAHNSHLVNLHFVNSYIKGKGGYLIMQDHAEIEVSTRKKEGFIKRLKEI